MALALIGIGSNIGARSAQLSEAVALLRQAAEIDVCAVSRWHETLPIGGPPGQGPFLNGALLLQTSLAPEALFQVLTSIENHLGRQRDVRWQARTVDLDLLLYDNLQISFPALSIPHPRFAYRRFVIEPAAEIAPDLVHPTIGWTLAQLRDHLRHAKPYVAIAGPPRSGKTHLAAALAEHFAGRRIESPRLLAGESGPSGSGRALAWELELLAERGALLAARTWPDETALAVSDFWLGQSFAYALIRLDPESLIEVSRRLADSVRWGRSRQVGRRDYSASGRVAPGRPSRPGDRLGCAEPSALVPSCGCRPAIGSSNGPKWLPP